MRVFTVFPLLVLPVLIYNVIAWSGSAFTSVDAVRERMDKDFLSVTMASDTTWDITPGHALIAFSLLMLFFELLKSTGTGRGAIINHAFSMVLFIVCLVEFLMFPAFATSVFFLVMMMTLLDVMAGFIVTIISARRDFGVSDGGFD
ncbi:hypothetical protein [Fretibacter rubidus]|uniref:hypothetical protein n=1 Tax=Fretibacter rubidus TaxID=570162 RepID=UPI00352B9900